MIKENFVSFAIAKLLKEKGFDGESHKHYWGYEPGKEFLTESSFDPEYDYPAPTLQVAMKWLREEKNIVIEINMDDYMTTEDGKLKIWYSYTIWTFIQHFGETGLVDLRFDDRAYW